MRKIIFYCFCLAGVLLSIYPRAVYSSSFRIWGLSGVDKLDFKNSFQRETLFTTGIQEDKVDEAIGKIEEHNKNEKFKENLEDTLKNIYTEVEARRLPNALSSKTIRKIIKAEAMIHDKEFMDHFQKFLGTLTVLSYPKDRVELVQKILENNNALKQMLEYYSKMRLYSIYAVNITERDFNRTGFLEIRKNRSKKYKELKVPVDNVDEVLLKALMIYQNFFPEELELYNKFLQSELRKKYDNSVGKYFSSLDKTYFKKLDDVLREYITFVDKRYEEEYKKDRARIEKEKEEQLRSREIEREQSAYIDEISNKVNAKRAAKKEALLKAAEEAEQKAAEDAKKKEEANKESEAPKTEAAPVEAPKTETAPAATNENKSYQEKYLEQVQKVLEERNKNQ